MIESGQLPAGTRLDNEIALADQLGVSRPTMRHAMDYLVERGLLVRKRGVGTQVVHARVRRPATLTSLYDHLAKTGRHPRTSVLSLAVEPASDSVGYALGVPSGTRVYAVQRLRYADDEPLAVLHNYVPCDRAELGSEDLETRGLYEILRDNGITMRIASQTVGARAATASEARVLGEPKGAPLLTATLTAYDDHGRAVDHGDHIYRASVYAFQLTLTSG
jgi:DNA-binding GntR family transcriptional regulator